MKKATAIATLVALLGFAHKTTAGDVIIDWDRVAYRAVVTDTANPLTTMPGPGWASRNLAMVSAAMCDAVNNAAATPLFTSYAYNGPTYQNASATVAAAYAARDVLSHLYTSAAQVAVFDQQLADSTAGFSGQALADGKTLGQAAAADVIMARALDGSSTSVSYSTQSGLGHYQLQLGQTAWGPNWGNVKPFVLNSAQKADVGTLIATMLDQHVPGLSALANPTATDAFYTALLSSPYFADVYNETVRLGGNNIGTYSTTRTADQTLAGWYWAYDVGGLGPPPVMYNEILSTIALQENNSLQQNARLFALANMAMADAGIASWQAKYQYDLFRPVTAVQNQSLLETLNPLIIPVDPGWTPLGAPNGIPDGLLGSTTMPNNSPFTPPFPAFTSGHASFGGALFQTIRDFYGTDAISFTFESDNLPTLPRTFSTLTDAEWETAESRIYLGIHWQFDANIGIDSGRLVSDTVFSNAFVPVPVPEPGTLTLAALVLVGLGFVALRKKFRRA